MPRIPRSERQEGLSVTHMPFSSYDAGAPGKALAGLGHALGGLGDDFAAAAKATEAEKNNLDDFQANMAYLDWKNGQDQKQAEYDQSITGDGRDHLTNRIQQFDQDADQFYSGLPANDHVRQKFALHLQRDRGDYGMKSYGVQQKQIQSYYTSEGTRYVTENVLPRLDGSKESLDMGFRAIDGMIGNSPGINPHLSDKMREQAAKMVFDAWLEKAGPDAAVEADSFISSYRRDKPLDGAPAADPRQGTLNRALPGLPAKGLPGSPSGEAAAKPRASLNPEQTQRLANVNSDVVDKFAALQDGASFKINSGYRDAEHNAKVGGARHSQHIDGNAIDIDVSDMSRDERVKVIEKASALGFTGIGVYDTAIHLDLGGRRAWGPSYHRDSLPKWAEAAIQGHESGSHGPNPDAVPDFSGRTVAGYWGQDKQWAKLSAPQKAAAMALLEADAKGGKVDLEAARNALGAMINRSEKDGVDLGEHVSGKIYQPTIEPTQYARLSKILDMKGFRDLASLAEARMRGAVKDWVSGATHFLAPEQTMLDLEAKNPQKYRSWRKWTGYDDNKGEYNNVVFRDKSHAFLAPEGVHVAGPGAARFAGQVADADGQLPDIKAQQPSTRDYFYGLLVRDHDQIVKKALQYERSQRVEEDRQLKDLRTETERQGIELSHTLDDTGNMKLTREWIEQNAEFMSNDRLNSFLKLVNPANPRHSETDPETLLGLEKRVKEAPAESKVEIFDARAAGLLSQRDYIGLMQRAGKELEEGGATPNWAYKLEMKLEAAIRPDYKIKDHDQIRKYHSAMRDYDHFIQEQIVEAKKSGKPLDRKKIEDYGDFLSVQFRKGAVQDKRSALDVPKFAAVPKDAMSLEELHKTVQKMNKAFAEGALSKEDFEGQKLVVKEWFDLLKAQAAADGKDMSGPKTGAGAGAGDKGGLPDFGKGLRDKGAADPQKRSEAPPRMMKRIVRDAQGNISGIIDEPVDATTETG